KFFCLLGPAGAGKTTTIKLIAGVEPVDQGKIFMDDQEVTHLLPNQRDVAVAFETYALYPQRTVRENLAFPLRAPIRRKEWSEEQIQARVEEIAKLLGIEDLLDRLPRQLSGGQRQRVALGRALVRKPKAYLLDEPIAHLDAKLRHRMRGELRRIQLELGITTVYTTPDQLEALSLADQMAVINEGKIEQVGSPAEIYQRPANVFVARFVGDPPMNIFHAEVEDATLCLFGGKKLGISEPLFSKLASAAVEKSLIIGIRPRDIRVLSPSSAEALWRGQVKYVQVLGETSILTVSTDSYEVRIKVNSQEAPKRGEAVGLGFDVRDCHFFDPRSERRID
ncbi:MAG: ABC transporter ATP-binding protein, partial [Anaerolineales bacterium]|nr:ABC transporter ATP-binding protein [Anaerolineales bacterium]MDW8447350.1 ABC transporter ATP-binding protein [Anaerolineales bacterium]